MSTDLGNTKDECRALAAADPERQHDGDALFVRVLRAGGHEHRERWPRHCSRPSTVSTGRCRHGSRASDLNRLNAAPVGAWVEIPRELMTVLAASLQDRTRHERRIRHRRRRHRFGLGLRRIAPARAESSARGSCASRRRGRVTTHVRSNLNEAGGKARKTAPLQLDLSGIAKGYRRGRDGARDGRIRDPGLAGRHRRRNARQGHRSRTARHGLSPMSGPTGTSGRRWASSSSPTWLSPPPATTAIGSRWTERSCRTR